jgi:hypothetical protein
MATTEPGTAVGAIAATSIGQSYSEYFKISDF